MPRQRPSNGVPGGPDWEACCSRLLRGRSWSRMMHRRVKLTDHGALRSQKAPQPGPLGSLSLRIFHSMTFSPIEHAWRSSFPRLAQWPGCGDRPAKANRVSWVGKPSANVIDAVGKLYAAMHHAGPRPTAAPREQKASRPTTPGTPSNGLCPQPASALASSPGPSQSCRSSDRSTERKLSTLRSPRPFRRPC